MDPDFRPTPALENMRMRRQREMRRAIRTLEPLGSVLGIAVYQDDGLPPDAWVLMAGPRLKLYEWRWHIGPGQARFAALLAEQHFMLDPPKKMDPAFERQLANARLIFDDLYTVLYEARGRFNP